MMPDKCIQACGDTWLNYVLLYSQSWEIQSHQDFSITIKKAVSATCGVAATHRLLKAVVDDCMHDWTMVESCHSSHSKGEP